MIGHCVPRSMTRSPSLRIQALEQPTSYELMFEKKLMPTIFTGSRIVDTDGNPLLVVLVDKNDGQTVRTSLPHPIKLEIVVLDGDFPSNSDNNESWTSEEFNNRIVKERTGKRPLLTGELNLTMRDGIAPIEDIEFTDNSSWIRSRKFRVAVRVAPGTNQTVRIREGMTEPFIVRDHRGECEYFLYQNLMFDSLEYIITVCLLFDFLLYQSYHELFVFVLFSSRMSFNILAQTY